MKIYPVSEECVSRAIGRYLRTILKLQINQSGGEQSQETHILISAWQILALWGGLRAGPVCVLWILGRPIFAKIRFNSVL